MQSLLLISLGAILILIGGIGLLTGNVLAGAIGIKSNYYNRNENPILFYTFVSIYIGIGALVIMKSI